MRNVFLIFFITIFHSNYAYSYNLFETSFYDVEFISKNIEDEKISIINQIKITSLQNILKKTLIEQDYINLNNDLTEDFINTLIKNIIINEEKIINNQYKSKIKINYNKKKIIDYYRSKNISYVDYLPNKFLLVILEDNKIDKNLFNKNNIYYKYLTKNHENHHLFKIPNLDINDRFILSAQDIINRDYKKLNNFFQKYNSQDNIIIIAKKNNIKIEFNIIVNSNQKIFEKKLNYNNNNIKTFFDILENEILNIWKQLNQIQNQNLNYLNCKVNYFNLLELKEIRKNLSKVSIIDKLSIKSLSHKNIEYEINFYGDSQILFKTMQLNNLNIHYNNKKCIISLI